MGLTAEEKKAKRKAYQKAYFEKNKEKILEQQRNNEKRREYKRDWQRRNKEKTQQYQLRHYVKKIEVEINPLVNVINKIAIICDSVNFDESADMKALKTALLDISDLVKVASKKGAN